MKKVSFYQKYAEYLAQAFGSQAFGYGHTGSKLKVLSKIYSKDYFLKNKNKLIGNIFNKLINKNIVENVAESDILWIQSLCENGVLKEDYQIPVLCLLLKNKANGAYLRGAVSHPLSNVIYYDSQKNGRTVSIVDNEPIVFERACLLLHEIGHNLCLGLSDARPIDALGIDPKLAEKISLILLPTNLASNGFIDFYSNELRCLYDECFADSFMARVMLDIASSKNEYDAVSKFLNKYAESRQGNTKDKMHNTQESVKLALTKNRKSLNDDFIEKARADAWASVILYLKKEKNILKTLENFKKDIFMPKWINKNYLEKIMFDVQASDIKYFKKDILNKLNENKNDKYKYGTMAILLSIERIAPLKYRLSEKIEKDIIKQKEKNRKISPFLEILVSKSKIKKNQIEENSSVVLNLRSGSFILDENIVIDSYLDILESVIENKNKIKNFMFFWDNFVS